MRDSRIPGPYQSRNFRAGDNNTPLTRLVFPILLHVNIRDSVGIYTPGEIRIGLRPRG